MREPLPTDPLQAFRVGDFAVDGLRATGRQQLSAEFTDHRGLIDLPVLGVLVDHLGGTPYAALGIESGALSMQARLSLSAVGLLGVDDLLDCSAELVVHDDAVATTAVTVTNNAGAGCGGTTSSVRVGRAAAGDGLRLPEALAGGDTGSPVSTATVVVPLDPALTGEQILDALAAGTLPGGPLMDLLDARVARTDEGVVLTARTHEWMANLFGTMHGGIVTTLLAQACSLAGQAFTTPDQPYRVGDISVGFYRSPAADGSEVQVSVRTVKRGRRISSFEASMTDADDRLLARAVADIYYG